MLRLTELSIVDSKCALKDVPDGKILVNTVNAHSFNVAQKDEIFADALKNGDYLIPDGASILMACRWLKAKSRPKDRIAGWDLFSFEMNRLERKSEMRKVKGEKLRVMFMGSSEKVLAKIRENAAVDYPNLDVVTYSPPYKPEFSEEDNAAMIKAINGTNPDLLWIGMTAPKQEKWTYQHWNEFNIHCHVGTIGAVFDFYAGTAKRAPQWWQDHFLEWFYRLCIEPKRMWRRYLLGNPLFIYNVIKEKLTNNNE